MKITIEDHTGNYITDTPDVRQIAHVGVVIRLPKDVIHVTDFEKRREAIEARLDELDDTSGELRKRVMELLRA
jgi:hypothetical protein